MIYTTEQQRKFLITVKDEFLSNYEHVPDMGGDSKNPLWDSELLTGWINDILRKRWYDVTDVGWINDIRLFYIQEKQSILDRDKQQ